MPKIRANNLSFNYDQQGSGEPLLLIPYTSADHMCYAFQVGEYAKHFTCISLDLRGTGESEGSAAAYSTETLADDVVAFMQALGIRKAHISGLSLGAAVGMWLAAKYPDKVQTLSLHGGWPKTDPFLTTLVEGWRMTAAAAPTIADMVIAAIFPWCLTPELYAAQPDFIQSLANFVRSRPAQSLASFLQQTDAVLGHDASAQLSRITATTQLTFGRRDAITVRFADRMKQSIQGSELLFFEGCAHAPLYEHVAEFNAKTLQFLTRAAAAAT